MSFSHMKYHPTLGASYIPNKRTRAVGPSGGYLIRTNAAGFRSNREFEKSKPPGTKRALVFGDSQTAGDGCANELRFTDLIEKNIDGLEVFNFGLSGSGPDQQLIAYQEHVDTEHDLLVICFNVENIRRVTRRFVKSSNERGEEIYCAKPYFEFAGNSLALKNVPVPKKLWTAETLPPDQRPYLYSFEETNFFSREDKTRLRIAGALGPLRQTAKSIAMRLSRYQPLPDYNDPNGLEWKLLSAILSEWISSSRTPVLLVLLPHYAHFLGSSDPSNYQRRFQELAMSLNLETLDVMPALSRLSLERRRRLWSDSYGHFSVEGHEFLGAAIGEKILEARFLTKLS